MDGILAEQLSLNYGSRTGIADVDLHVPPGEIFGFLGPNGAGKTTTIRILLGLLQPSHGRARIFGLDCWSQSPRIKADLGYLPGDVRLYPWFTGNRALRIVSSIRGRKLTPRGLELLDRFQLDPSVPVRKMSKGMRQKLGIVLALVHQPRLLILDEPTSGLDPLMCDQLYACLREASAAGSTIFFSSHTLSEVELLCNRIAIVRRGQIVADETMETLRRRARRTVVLRFREEASARGISPPDFLHVSHREGVLWQGELVGTPPQLMGWAAGQPLEDISISPPSLESLFRRFYDADQPPQISVQESTLADQSAEPVR